MGGGPGDRLVLAIADPDMAGSENLVPDLRNRPYGQWLCDPTYAKRRRRRCVCQKGDGVASVGRENGGPTVEAS